MDGGGTHAVEYKSDSEIIISYDALVASEKNVQTVAETHCQTYGKHANLKAVQSDKESLGLIKTLSFRCQELVANAQPKKSWGAHPNSMGYNKVKKLTFISNPSGADIFSLKSDGLSIDKYLCQTPCIATIDSDKFNGRPQEDIYVKSVWLSGAYNRVLLTVKRGVHEKFEFNRPDVANYQKDLSVERQQELHQTSGWEDLASALLVGAIIVGTAYADSPSSTPSLVNGWERKHIERREQDVEGRTSLEVNGKHFSSCFRRGSELDCEGTRIVDLHPNRGDGWHQIEIDGESMWCQKKGDEFVC